MMLNKFEISEDAIANAYTYEESNFQMPPTTTTSSRSVVATCAASTASCLSTGRVKVDVQSITFTKVIF
jgi:hypothetical protein